VSTLIFQLNIYYYIVIAFSITNIHFHYPLNSLSYLLFIDIYSDSNAVSLDIKSAAVVSKDVTLFFNVTISASAVANFVFSACCILSISCDAENPIANILFLSTVRKSSIQIP
jgi:hypothetical protein